MQHVVYFVYGPLERTCQDNDNEALGLVHRGCEDNCVNRHGDAQSIFHFGLLTQQLRESYGLHETKACRLSVCCRKLALISDIR